MIKNSVRMVGALALAVALLSNGPVSAASKKPPAAAALQGDLNSTRTQVTVVVPYNCPTPPPDTIEITTTKTANVSVNIFQSVGRLLNIGTSLVVDKLPCSGTGNVEVTVDAIEGLTFQPGPSTLLVTQTETTTIMDAVGSTESTSPPVSKGFRVDLRP